jgi:hypothetical protein
LTSDKLGNDSYYARQANPYRGYGAEPPGYLKPANTSKTAENPRNNSRNVDNELQPDVVLTLSKDAKDPSKAPAPPEDTSKQSGQSGRPGSQDNQNNNASPQDSALAFVPNSSLTVSLNKHKADPQFQKAYDAYGMASTVAYDIRTVDIYV